MILMMILIVWGDWRKHKQSKTEKARHRTQWVTQRQRENQSGRKCRCFWYLLGGCGHPLLVILHLGWFRCSTACCHHCTVQPGKSRFRSIAPKHKKFRHHCALLLVWKRRFMSITTMILQWRRQISRCVPRQLAHELFGELLGASCHPSAVCVQQVSPSVWSRTWARAGNWQNG